MEIDFWSVLFAPCYNKAHLPVVESDVVCGATFATSADPMCAV